MRTRHSICVWQRAMIFLLVAVHFGRCSDSCAKPEPPENATLSSEGPFNDGDTVDAECRHGLLIGVSRLWCSMGKWIPPEFGDCSDGEKFYCPKPTPPDGGNIRDEGPFHDLGTARATCDDGGRVIGVSELLCLLGKWVPPSFGECSNIEKYSCKIPQPAGMTVSAEGITMQSHRYLLARCNEDMKVVIGARKIRCVLGHWTPSHFGCCRDVSELGTVVYRYIEGQTVIKYHNGTFINDLGSAELLMEFLNGGYGITDIQGFKGKEESEGHKWRIFDDKIYQDEGVEVPQATYGTIKMKGWKIVPEDSGLPTLPDRDGVLIKDEILYIDGKPTVQRNNDSDSSVDIFNVPVVDETKGTEKPFVTSSTTVSNSNGEQCVTKALILCVALCFFRYFVFR